MPLGMEVRLGSGDCVRWGPSYLQKKGHTHPTQFLAHVYCGHGRSSQLVLRFAFVSICSESYRRIYAGRADVFIVIVEKISKTATDGVVQRPNLVSSYGGHTSRP